MVTRNQSSATPGSHAYRTIWRWHFYAGLFVLPFILILSVTGAIYLFKPQIDRWQERAYQGLVTTGTVSPDRQLSAAMAASPGVRFNYYRLPERPGDAAMIHVIGVDGAQRDIFVSPQGKVIGERDPSAKISETIARIHGSLLIGSWGDWLVELAASWTIVMILTGLYLWWPRPFRFAGTLWPRLSLKGRPLLKDIHRATGFWLAGLVLVMLASGLPWAGVWGSTFKWTRTELGLVNGPQDWKVGAEGGHAGHHSGMQMAMPAIPVKAGLPLSVFVQKAKAEHLAFPAIILPPHAPQRFGPPTGNEWTAKSEAQNRWLGRQVTYDPATGGETGRRGFDDQHVIDRIVNTGVAWHEGQLFGWVNQLIGVLTAIALIAVSILGVLMWLKRRPQGSVGAPPVVEGKARGWMITSLVVLALLLPLFGASLIFVLAAEWLCRRSILSSRS
ncbi:PepSY-associated TM helix domain-containing protein [Sphingobium sp. UBA5915]|uniref:PepSY-associated TM helix domain-containing protein n=1 Tax=Sphingobium sp. UBA5915 TaxID=1947530 RepID=UPI0025E5FDD7|nr:PepSY domain-containing protein [Sphingobium sp. UBA5915]